MKTSQRFLSWLIGAHGAHITTVYLAPPRRKRGGFCSRPLHTHAECWCVQCYLGWSSRGSCLAGRHGSQPRPVSSDETSSPRTWTPFSVRLLPDKVTRKHPPRGRDRPSEISYCCWVTIASFWLGGQWGEGIFGSFSLRREPCPRRWSLSPFTRV